MVEQVSVVYGDDVRWTGGGEVDAGFAVGDDGVVGVDEGGGDVGDVVPVWGNTGVVSWAGWLVSCAAVRPVERMRWAGLPAVRSSSVAMVLLLAGDGFEGAGFVGDLVGDGAGVGVEFLGAQGFVVEEELDLFGVGVDFDVFGVGGLVMWKWRGPVEEERLGEARGGVERGVGRGGGLIAGGG